MNGFDELLNDIESEKAQDKLQTKIESLAKQLASSKAETLKSMEDWLDTESQSYLGDGYDYDSGVEYGLRCAAIEAKKRRKALTKQG